LLAPLVGALVS